MAVYHCLFCSLCGLYSSGGSSRVQDLWTVYGVFMVDPEAMVRYNSIHALEALQMLTKGI